MQLYNTEPRGVCSSATIKREQVILDFDMVSKIITFEQKGKLWIFISRKFKKIRAITFAN